MQQVWRWLVTGIAVAIVADYLLDVLPRLLPSLVVLALVVMALRIVWARTRW